MSLLKTAVHVEAYKRNPNRGRQIEAEELRILDKILSGGSDERETPPETQETEEKKEVFIPGPID